MGMLKVMVVEDEEHIRMILGKMIEKNEGCEVVSSCGNFAAAISDFMKCRPQVVFMDIDLGGDSGLECAKAITEVDPKVKIVFATAHSEYMANAFEIYAFDYLVKPFDMERIAKTLNRIKSMTEEESGEKSASENDAREKSDSSCEKLIIRISGGNVDGYNSVLGIVIGSVKNEIISLDSPVSERGKCCECVHALSTLGSFDKFCICKNL